MKVKHLLIFGIIGMLGVLFGAFFKIQHWPGSNIVLGVSLLIELIAGILIVFKLLKHKSGSDFLNS